MSARRGRSRNSYPLLISAAISVTVLLALSHVIVWIAIAAIPAAYVIGHRHGSRTQTGSLSQQCAITGLRAELADARERVRSAEESANLAWDAAAEQEPVKPCPECGSRLAYSHMDGCPRSNPHARETLLSDSLSGVRPLGNGE